MMENGTMAAQQMNDMGGRGGLSMPSSKDSAMSNNMNMPGKSSEGMSNDGMASGEQSMTKKVRSGDEQPEEKDFDKETQKALEEIDTTQNEVDALNEQASEEILKVEQKYNKMRRPYYDKRNEIIKRVPKFWLTAFINHPQMSAIIEEDEEDCLQYLNKLEVEEHDDIKSGYRIKLHFDQNNPYFENDILTKEFHMGPSGDPASQSTSITWKEGFNLAAKAAQRAATAAARSGQKRPLENRTFFSWFCDNTDPSSDDVAEVIKDDMWPNPLQYFLVPDIEVENGGEDEEDLEEEEEEVDENVVVLEEEEEEGGDGEFEEEAEEEYDEDMAQQQQQQQQPQ